MSITETSQENQVLSTLNEDGSRRWLRPRLSRGRFLLRRRIVGYSLIALFTVIPYIRLNGKPLILLDVPRREFTLFGATFLPTDTLLLSLFMIGIFLLVFFLTALLGRVWCGWGCPQTVYLELVYRPIERFFEGEPGKRRPGSAIGARKALKWVMYLLVSMALAHTFLAYFVGIDRLFVWVRQSPLEHPASFLIMLSVTALMLFDFGFFREQMCIVACPYGRFQSVMLDRDTLIIGYDQRRGEPRGKAKRHPPNNHSLQVLDPAPATAPLPQTGDCVDCRLCVQTCPTGIDIRHGLQMECIGCAQCIDACDAVMDKLGRERGLIRYSSQTAMSGRPRRVIRPRIIIYPLGLVAIVGLLIAVLIGQGAADVKVLRGPGMPFNILSDGEVANQVRVKVTNRSSAEVEYTVSVLDPGLLLMAEQNTLRIGPGEQQTMGVLIVGPPLIFENGRFDATVRVTDGQNVVKDVRYRLLGPRTPGGDTAGGSP